MTPGSTADAPDRPRSGLLATGWEALARADARLGVSRLVPTGSNAVLMYHSVGGGEGNTGDRVLSVDQFRTRVRTLAERGWLADLPAVLDGVDDDRRRVAITFDDGYEDVFERALPVLREFDAPATCFLIADHVGGRSETGVPYMSDSQVRRLVDGDLVTVGNHTRTHARLSEIDDEATLQDEVVGARTALQERFGVEVDRFCYPYGEYSPAALALVRDTHEVATAGTGLVRSPVDPHRVPRIDGSAPAPVVRWELTALGDWLRRLAVGSA